GGNAFPETTSDSAPPLVSGLLAGAGAGVESAFVAVASSPFAGVDRIGRSAFVTLVSLDGPLQPFSVKSGTSAFFCEPPQARANTSGRARTNRARTMRVSVARRGTTPAKQRPRNKALPTEQHPRWGSALRFRFALPPQTPGRVGFDHGHHRKIPRAP